MLQNPNDGSIHFLNITDGEVEQIASRVTDFEEKLADPENLERWLNCLIVDGQAALGMRPAADQCLSFVQPPILGGRIQPNNFEICDITVHLSISGQVLRQVKELPPGTRIRNISIQTPETEHPKAWWKFW